MKKQKSEEPAVLGLSETGKGELVKTLTVTTKQKNDENKEAMVTDTAFRPTQFQGTSLEPTLGQWDMGSLPGLEEATAYVGAGEPGLTDQIKAVSQKAY